MISVAAIGTLSNTVTALLGEGVIDPTPANNSATDTDTLTAEADVSIALADTPDPVSGLGSLVYSISVANAGPSAARGVSVVQTLPAGVSLSSAAGTDWSCGEASGTLTCTRATLGLGAGPNITVAVTVGPAATVLSSSATVTIADTDPDLANNSDGETTTVSAAIHALSMTTEGAGRVTSSPAGIDCGSDCSEGYEHGSTVTLTATPSADSAFVVWGGACSGSTATCVVTMDAAKSVSATFTLPGFRTVSPCRIFDSRDGSLGGPSPLAAGSETPVLFAGRCGIPAHAKTVSVNVTATQPSSAGFLTLYPTGLPTPAVSSINFSRSQTRGNNAVVGLASTGEMTVFAGLASGSVHVIIDVNGCFE